MEATNEGSYIWIVLLAAGVIIYAGYLFFKRRQTENPRNRVSPFIPRVDGGSSLSTLRAECWKTYVELENVRNLKDKCAKIVGGDISVMTAIRQLETIFASCKSDRYMAPRIVGQVCDFLTNMATANKMIDNEGNFIMPQASPHLLDEGSYFANIEVEPTQQAAKYEAVIKYQTKALRSEQSNLRSVETLQLLLTPLQKVSYITKNEQKLSAEEIVVKAEDMYNEISPILEQYEFKK